MPHPRFCALIAVLLLTLLTPASLLAGPQGPTVTPPEPTYFNDFADCVTGDNQFYNSYTAKFRWYINQAIGADGSTSPYKCDSYQNDQYERPTSQTFDSRRISEKPPYSPPPTPSSPTFLSGLLADSEFGVGDTVYSTAGGLYHEYVDITRAWAGHDSGWMFFRIELFGDYEVDSAAKRTYKFGDGTYYTVRLGNVNAAPNQKANGGIILRNQWGTSQPTSWNTDPSSVKIFVDTNYDVSGYQGVNFTKDDGDTMPPQDGYDLDRQNNGYLYVRKAYQSFTGPGGTVDRPVMEFAFNYAAYNQAFNADFTPYTLTYLEFDATRGLKDNQNYLWNDEYTLNEAGSPNPTSGLETCNLGYGPECPPPPGNIYELDTLRGDGAFGKGSIGDCIWHDEDRDGNGPEGCTKGPEFDNNEARIPNVDVQLNILTGSNTVAFVDTATTDANGKYLFTDLDPGDYIVDVQELGVFNHFGGPYVNTTIEPYLYSLAKGENHRNADFGYDNEPGAVYVGDWVWYDINANGQQDDGVLLYSSPYGDMYDTGIPCVEIRLYVGLTSATNVSQLTWIGVANTDTWGNYAFPLLIPSVSGESYFTGIGVGVDEDVDVLSFMDYYEGRRPDTTCNLATPWVDPAYVFGSTAAASQPRIPEQVTTPPLQNTTLPNPGGFDLTLDFGFTSSPLAVSLASFQAAAQADSVLVTWETVSELGNTGFNLYRAQSVDGERTWLGWVASQAPGSVQGASYSYEDVDVIAGQAYWYWLEDISVNGAATLHGPASAVFQSPTAVTLSAIEASPPAASSLPVIGALLLLLLAPVGAVWARRRA